MLVSKVMTTEQAAKIAIVLYVIYCIGVWVVMG